MEDGKFIKLELSDASGQIRVNVSYISHYRPFVDDQKNVKGSIVDFCSGDCYLVNESPEELDRMLLEPQTSEAIPQYYL